MSDDDDRVWIEAHPSVAFVAARHMKAVDKLEDLINNRVVPWLLGHDDLARATEVRLLTAAARQKKDPIVQKMLVDQGDLLAQLTELADINEALIESIKGLFP